MTERHLTCRRTQVHTRQLNGYFHNYRHHHHHIYLPWNKYNNNTHNCFTALWILSGTTRVSEYQKKHSPTHTYCGHQSALICFFHLIWSMAFSSLFNPCGWQCFSTVSLQGSALSPLLFVIVMEALSGEFSVDLIKRLNEWKDFVENRGMRVNMNKTKIMTSGEWLNQILVSMQIWS